MDTKRLQELAGVQLDEGNTISSDPGGKIDTLVMKLASAILEDGVKMAKKVYEEEGAGRSGAKNEAEYVRYATKRFLDKGYQEEIMANVVEDYNDLLH